MADEHVEPVPQRPSLCRILAPLAGTEPEGTARVIIDAVLEDGDAADDDVQ